MVKAAIEREESDARISYPERKQARNEVSTANGQCSSDLECYLITALFIVTHNPEYRKVAKAWRKSHPDCSLAIRRFLSIAKQIRC